MFVKYVRLSKEKAIENLLEKANGRQKIRLWVMDYFRILPTDPRMKQLTAEQAEILFLNHCSLPDDRSLKTAFREQKETEQALMEFPEEEFREMGYTDEEIEELKKDIHG
jgi:hypothetical protein